MAKACLWYGTQPMKEISMGPNAWYTVEGDGKGGSKLRQEAEYSSAEAGEAQRLSIVRVDKVKELANGKLRAHICEVKKGSGRPCVGWCAAKMLICETKAAQHLLYTVNEVCQH